MAERINSHKKSWDLHIDESVALPVEIMLVDPKTGKVKRGARATLVTQLLRQWLENLSNNPQEEI